MGFAGEVRDFLAGYKTVTELGQASQKGKLDREKMEADKAYQDAMIELRRDELGLQRDKFMADNARAGASAAASAARAAKDAEMDALRMKGLNLDLEIKGETLAANRAAREATAAQKTDASMEAVVANPGVGVDNLPADRWTQDFAEGGLVHPSFEEIQPRGANLDTYPQVRTQPGQSPVAQTALPTTGAPAPGSAPSAPAQTAPAPPAQVRPPSALPVDGPDDPMPTPVAHEVNPNVMRIVVDRGRQAAKEAMDNLESTFTTPRSAVDGTAPAGGLPEGMTPQELEEIGNKVDPNGTIPDFLKTSAKLAEVVTYFRNNGEPEKAAIAAQKLLMGEYNMSRTLGNLAIQAIEGGNVPEGCRLINDACNRFPSAHEIRVTPDQNGIITYEVKEYGKVLESGRVDAAQLMEIAGQVGDGTLFMRTLADFVSDNTPKQDQNPGQALVIAGRSIVAAQQLKSDIEAGLVDDPEAAQEELARLSAAAESAYTRALDLGHKPADIANAMRASTGVGGDPSATPPGNTQNMPAPTSKAEYDALPSGTRYRHPDGSIKTKP